MNNRAIKATIFVMLGCMLNNIFLEYIVKLDSGAGHLITFCQFLFIAVYGFINTSEFGKNDPKIPRKEYCRLTLLFFINSVFGNWLFSFHIPVPLMMIFRSGTLIANMIMGVIIMKKRYTFEKYMSVLLVTLGIILCTFYSNNITSKKSCRSCDDPLGIQDERTDYSFWFIVGVILSTATLLFTAALSVFQEKLYRKYGKHDREALYYTHLYGLVGFLAYHENLRTHAEIATNSEPLHLNSINVGVPWLWIFLILNAVTQYVCVSNVYILFTECQSLTVTLVLTLRKLFSLLFSIVYFQNPFTNAHWVGAVLVFIGTLMFSETHYQVKQIWVSNGKKIKER